MIRVQHAVGHDTFTDDVELKVLASGALKVVQPVVLDIPVLGSEDSKDIIKAPEKVLAVFNCKYIVTRTEDES